MKGRFLQVHLCQLCLLFLYSDPFPSSLLSEVELCPSPPPKSSQCLEVLVPELPPADRLTQMPLSLWS